MFRRCVDLGRLVQARSLLLLGPRQTGKSTLLRASFPHAIHLDLLHAATWRSLAARPERLVEHAAAAPRGASGLRIVVVDEVQKLPALLDEAHRLLEARQDLRFVLTGSSARKLRRAGVNLLGGRASRVTLHPLVHPERSSDTGNPVSLARALARGGLPRVVLSDDPRRDLLDYVGLYLQEEVRAEGLARNHEAFARFLEVAAATHGEQAQFAGISRDAEVPARTVREYYGILEDTLVGRLLPAFRGTSARKAMATAKFYFFDVGVANALLGRFWPQAGTPEWGRALEHLVLVELQATLDYRRLDARLCYWRSLSRLEVDFVVESRGVPLLLVEVKASGAVAARDLRGLRALAEEYPAVRRICVCTEPERRRTEDGVEILPVEAFLDALWAGQIVPENEPGSTDAP